MTDSHSERSTELTPDEMRHFAREGYVVIPDVLDLAQLTRGVRAVDAIMAASPPPDDHTGYHFYWLDDPGSHGALIDCLEKSPALDVIKAMVAPLALEPVTQIQVSTTPPPWSHHPVRGHLDGLTPPEDDGRPGTFSLLAGLFLTDQSAEDMGNLWVWPGSHLSNADYFTSGKSDEEIALEPYPPVDLPEPRRQVTGRAGDLLLANYLLSHNMGGNTSDQTRKVLYFRIKAATHRNHWHSCIRDPLFEFQPVRGAMASSE